MLLVTDHTLLPGLGLGDLRPDSISRARRFGSDTALSDADFLLRAELAREDARTGRIGIALPALLLFGTGEALRAALPGLVTRLRFRDARGREEREEVRANLLDTLDRLRAFAARHLPEAPVLAGRPADLRDRVLGEAFLDGLLRRDYSKPFAATFEIGRAHV